jgi:hypothetical protein
LELHTLWPIRMGFLNDASFVGDNAFQAHPAAKSAMVNRPNHGWHDDCCTSIASHYRRLGEDYVFIYTFWIDNYITGDRRNPFWMLFKHEGGRHSTCASNCDAGTASRCTSTDCRCASSCPRHSRTGIGGEPNNYLDELG